MTFRSRANLIAVIVVIATVWATAQTQAPKPPSDRIPLNRMDLVAPTVISGSDLGFRIESHRNNIPVGKLVVRIKGVWVDAQVGSSGVVVAGQ